MNLSSFMRRTRKKLISSVAAVSLLVSGVSAGAGWPSTAAAAETAFISVSFAGAPTTPSTAGLAAEVGGNWGVYSANVNQGDYVVGVGEVGGRSDRSLKLFSTTQNLYIARSSLDTVIQSAKYVIDASLYMEDTAHERFLQIQNAGTSPVVYARLVSFDKTGRIKLLGNVDVGAYEANRWYQVRMIVDNQSRVVEYFLDGQPIATASTIQLNAVWTKPSSMRVQQDYVTGTTGVMAVDDIRVASYEPVSSLTLQPTELTVAEGTSATLDAQVQPADATDRRLNWSSDNVAVATVDANGRVTGVAQGTATITATSAANGAVSATAQVTVTPVVPVASVTLPETRTIQVTEEVYLDAVVLPTDATHKALLWNSDNTAVAQVDPVSGRVVGVSPGIATITAAANGGAGPSGSTLLTVEQFVPLTGISLPATTGLTAGSTQPLNVTYEPAEATNKRLLWSSDDDAVATVDADGVVTAVAPGTTIVRAVAEDGGWTAQTTVQVDARVVPVQRIDLPATAQVDAGDTIRLRPVFEPADATNRQLTWSSNRTDLATVAADGTITGIAPGTAIITATSADSGAAPGQTVVTIRQPDAAAADEYEQLLGKWRGTLIGTAELDRQAADYLSYAQDLSARAESLWASMLTSPDRTALWSAVPASASDSAYVTEWFTRLKTLTVAYSLPGSTLYHNLGLRDDIIAAMAWIQQHHYRAGAAEFGNWWNWDIGVPLRLADIAALIGDELPQSLLADYTAAMDHYIGDIGAPTFTQVGANRADILTAELMIGLANKDDTRLAVVRDQMSPLFDYTTEQDGFYEDGSFVQHVSIAYTGSYGEVLIRGAGNLLYVLSGSRWEPTDPDAANVYRWITENFAPVMYQGQVMDLVRGRAIAREKLDGYKAATGIYTAIARLSMIAPGEMKDSLRGLVKYGLSRQPDFEPIESMPLDLAGAVKSWLNDPGVAAPGELPAHYALNGMARTVHVGDNYAFGISKSSNRISTYELTNGENGEGWYTGDGMTYLYTSDMDQYRGDFWPTVNRYRLPGTTVDIRPRTVPHYQYGDGEAKPTNAWAGGVALGQFGVSGMNLRQIGTTLTANKAWFMFDDEIVALGSGISSTDGRTIETIVEQRKLRGDASNALTVDGTAKPTAAGWSETVANPGWAHLEGNVAGADVGYVFPDGQSVRFLRELRTGKWRDINDNDGISEDPRTDAYATMWFDHGVSPDGAGYEYVLLPGKSQAQTSAYAGAPDITVLANTDKVQAVRENKLGMTGFAFWSGEPAQADFVTASREAAVMVRENAAAHELEVAVSDPTLGNTGVIELELDRSAAAIVSRDAEVSVIQLHPTIKLSVNVGGSLSKSFVVKFDMDPALPRPQPTADVPEPAGDKEAMPAVPPIAHLFEGYDAEAAGNRPTGWTAAVVPDTSVALVKLQQEEGLALRLLDGNANGAAQAVRAIPSQAGTFEMEWKFAAAYADKPVTFELLGGGVGKTAAVLQAVGTSAAAGSSGGASEGLKLGLPGGGLQRVAALTAGEWHHVFVRVRPAHGTLDVYLNGQAVALDARFADASVSAIDGLRVTTGAADAPSAVYVDDLIVYTYGAVPYVNETFDAVPVGEKPNGWTIAERAGSAPVSVTERPDGSGRSLLLNDNDNLFVTSASRVFPAQTGKLTAQWNYYEMNSGKFPAFELLDGTKSAIKLNVSGYLKVVGPGNVSTDVLRLETRKWFEMRVDIDIAANTFDLYVDGQLIRADAPFWNAASKLDTIRFSTSYGAVDAPLYIDDVKVYGYETLVDRVTASQGSLTLEPGAEADVSAVVTPAGAANGELEWSSSDAAVATVDELGHVVAVSAGQAVVTVQTADGRERATIAVRVTSPDDGSDPGDGGGEGSDDGGDTDTGSGTGTDGQGEGAGELSAEDAALVRGLLEEVKAGTAAVAERVKQAVAQAASIELAAAGVEGVAEVTEQDWQRAKQRVQALAQELKAAGYTVGAGGDELPPLTIRLGETGQVALGKMPAAWFADFSAVVAVREDGVRAVLPKSLLSRAAGSAALALEIEREGERAIRVTVSHLDANGAEVQVQGAVAGGERLGFAIPYRPGEGQHPDYVAVRAKDAAGELTLLPGWYRGDAGLVEFGVEAYGSGTYEIIWNPVEFADVASGHWAAHVIRTLAAKGIVDGRGPDGFEPEGAVSRAEFVKLLLATEGGNRPGASAGTAGDGGRYPDVSADSWYAAWISAAAQRGWIEGDDTGSFRPDDAISRQDLVVLLARAFRPGEKASAEDLRRLDAYADGAAVAGYAREAMAIALREGWVSGRTDVTVAPLDAASRAETAALLYRAVSGK